MLKLFTPQRPASFPGCEVDLAFFKQNSKTLSISQIRKDLHNSKESDSNFFNRFEFSGDNCTNWHFLPQQKQSFNTENAQEVVGATKPEPAALFLGVLKTDFAFGHDSGKKVFHPVDRVLRHVLEVL